MKKFNPEKEINKVSFNNSLSKDSKINNAFIPLLVLGCSCLAMIGITFSYKLVETSKEKYTVDINIYNGEEEKFHDEVIEGPYSARIVGNGAFSYIDCSSGKMDYDSFTETINIPYLDSNVKCDIYFEDDSAKYLSVDGLNSVNDNKGISSYFRADSVDNYIKVNNMMFRIVRINGDGSLRIILDDNSLSTSFGNNNVYLNSNLQKVLNDWYKQHFAGKKYVVVGDFDINNYIEYDSDNLLDLDGYYENYVGALNVREADLILRDAKANYVGNILLMNGTGTTDVYSILNNKIVKSKSTTSLVVKPVININADNLDGVGTVNDPYVLKED